MRFGIGPAEMVIMGFAAVIVFGFVALVTRAAWMIVFGGQRAIDAGGGSRSHPQLKECPGCGAKIALQHAFCPDCGLRVSA